MDFSNSSIRDLQILFLEKVELYKALPSEELEIEIRAIDVALNGMYNELYSELDKFRTAGRRLYFFMLFMFALMAIGMGAYFYLIF